MDDNNIFTIQKYLDDAAAECRIGVFMTGNDAGSDTELLHSADDLLSASMWLTQHLQE